MTVCQVFFWITAAIVGVGVVFLIWRTTQEVAVSTSPGRMGSWSKLAWVVFFTVLGLWLITVIVVGVLFSTTESTDSGSARVGQFGDAFGVLNALFSGLAFAMVVVALFLQRQEIKEQREEARLTALLGTLAGLQQSYGEMIRGGTLDINIRLEFRRTLLWLQQILDQLADPERDENSPTGLPPHPDALLSSCSVSWKSIRATVQSVSILRTSSLLEGFSYPIRRAAYTLRSAQTGLQHLEGELLMLGDTGIVVREMGAVLFEIEKLVLLADKMLPDKAGDFWNALEEMLDYMDLAYQKLFPGLSGTHTEANQRAQQTEQSESEPLQQPED